MKNIRSSYSKFLFAFLGVFSLLAVLACGFGGAFSLPATATPTNTATLEPTSASTPIPTNTSTPTETPTATPAPVGSTVTYGSLEITVIDVINRESVHFGDVDSGWETFYTPSDGHYLIDVGVLVHNSKPGNAVHMRWKDVYVVEENGDAWQPIWGSIKMVDSGTKVDPFSIGLSSTDLDGDADIEFDNDTYLRLIYGVKDDPNQTILFGVQDSPMISFTLNE